jgi:hypothetical protein
MMIQKRRCKRKSKQRENEELSATLAEKLFNEAHHGAEALVEIHFLLFDTNFFLRFEAHPV